MQRWGVTHWSEGRGREGETDRGRDRERGVPEKVGVELGENKGGWRTGLSVHIVPHRGAL